MFLPYTSSGVPGLLYLRGDRSRAAGDAELLHWSRDVECFLERHRNLDFILLRCDVRECELEHGSRLSTILGDRGPWILEAFQSGLLIQVYDPKKSTRTTNLSFFSFVVG